MNCTSSPMSAPRGSESIAGFPKKALRAHFNLAVEPGGEDDLLDRLDLGHLDISFELKSKVNCLILCQTTGPCGSISSALTSSNPVAFQSGVLLKVPGI